MIAYATNNEGYRESIGFHIYNKESKETWNKFMEGLNKELKRPSNVIGIFPAEESLLRLMGAVLMERNEVLSSLRRIFQEKTYQELMATNVSKKLLELAEEQNRMLAA